MQETPTTNLIGKSIEMLMHRLSKTGRRYRLQTVEVGKVPDLFQIAEKAPAGQAWTDGSNWRTFRGPSAKQMRIIEQTSQNVHEMVDRIEGFIFRGEDTTKQMVPQNQVSPFNEDAINRIVAAKVEAILADRVKMREVTAGRLSAEEAVEVPVMTHIPKRVGLQPKKIRGKHQTAREQALAVVRERCILLGIPEKDIRTNGSGNINKLWKKQFDVMWAQYCARNAQTTEQAVEIARQQPEASQA